MDEKQTDKVIFFFLFVICIILTLSNSLHQVAVDGGLALTGVIDYPEPFSPLKYYYFNSWTLLHQFSAILIKFNLSVENISRIILFLSIFCFGVASYIIIKKFTGNKYLALLVSFLVLVFQKNFGDTDYPSLVISNHSYGMFSLAISSLIFALILDKKLRLSGFFSGLLISIHPVIGIWMFLILMISVFLQRDIKLYPKLVMGFFLGFLITVFSYIIFTSYHMGKLEYSLETFDNYMKLWDGHRNTAGYIHYEYLIKTLALFLLFNIYYIFLKKDYKNLFFYVINLSIILSTIIYLLYKFYPNYFPSWIVKTMPSRFIILHSFIGWPIIICLIYKIFLNYKFKKKKIQIFIISLLLIYSIQHYKNFIKIKDNLLLQFLDKNRHIDEDIFKEISKINTDNYFIATKSSTKYINNIAKKPVLVHLHSFDFIPYHPYLTDYYFEILKDIYEISILDPPIKNRTDIPDDFIKNAFEKRNKNQWVILSKKYNANYIVVPSSWDIRLDLFKAGKSFSIYKIK